MLLSYALLLPGQFADENHYEKRWARFGKDKRDLYSLNNHDDIIRSPGEQLRIA